MQKCRLIFFECNDIIRFLFNNLTDNFLLATHRICGHNCILNPYSRHTISNSCNMSPMYSLFAAECFQIQNTISGANDTCAYCLSIAHGGHKIQVGTQTVQIGDKIVFEVIV